MRSLAFRQGHTVSNPKAKTAGESELSIPNQPGTVQDSLLWGDLAFRQRALWLLHVSVSPVNAEERLVVSAFSVRI